MTHSARSCLTAGISLTAAAAIALTPVAVAPPVPAPPVALTLTANPAIGVVDTIVTTIDDVFTRLSAATTDPTAAGSLDILRGLSVRAFAMLAENLRRGDAVNAATTAQVRDLVTEALTGSLRHVLTAAAQVADAPLSPAGYAGLLSAWIVGAQLLAGNGLDVIQAVGDAGFALAGIALDEVTFQADNGLGGLSTLLTRLGDASGSPIIAAVVKVVQGLTFAPALAVIDAGSRAAGAVLGAANAGFDAVLDGAGAVVGAPKRVTVAVPDDEDPQRTVRALRSEEPAVAKHVDDDPVAEEAVDSKALDDDPADETEADLTDVSADDPAAEPDAESTAESTSEPKETVGKRDSDEDTAQDTQADTTASGPDTADAAA